MKALVMSVIFAGLSETSAQPFELRERTEFYDVYGTTAEALTQQMSQRGPVHSGGRAWAFTRWELRSRYGLVPTSDGCRIESPRVRLEVVTTFPRWMSGSQAPWRPRADWKRLMLSIRQHEDIHRAHAQDAAHRTVVLLAHAPPAADCTAAERAARDITRAQSEQARSESLAFDRATEFGAREGVSLGR